MDALGLPLTEQKLAQTTMQQLRTAADGELSQVPQPALKQALEHLWGKAQVEVAEDRPTLDAYTEGEYPDPSAALWHRTEASVSTVTSEAQDS